MVKGILADNNVIGQVAYLVKLMQAHGWEDFWNELGLSLYQFEDIGLLPAATDVEIWQRSQAEQLILITDNRNDDSPESLNAAIRQFNTPQSLPVFTISDLEKFGSSTRSASWQRYTISYFVSTRYAEQADSSCRDPVCRRLQRLCSHAGSKSPAAGGSVHRFSCY